MAKSTPTEFNDLAYEQASAELDEIVEFFESSDVDVDDVVVKLERRLTATRMQVEELSPKLAAAASRSAAAVDPETGEIIDA